MLVNWQCIKAHFSRRQLGLGGLFPRRHVHHALALLGGHGGGQVDVDLHVGAAALGVHALAVGVASSEREEHRRHVSLHRQLVQLGDQFVVLLCPAPIQRLLHLGVF